MLLTGLSRDKRPEALCARPLRATSTPGPWVHRVPNPAAPPKRSGRCATKPRREYADGATHSTAAHTHAILVFDQPVCGPVLIGAGRFRANAVCRAMDG